MIKQRVSPGHHRTALVRHSVPQLVSCAVLIALLCLLPSCGGGGGGANTGSVSVSSTPSGAAIWLDGQNTGKVTPATLSGVTSGNHTLILTLNGYKDWQTNVNVVAGQTATVSATLVPATSTGSIHVESTPPGARIWLDGVDTLKVTPATITGVTPGNRTVKLTLPGYEDSVTYITVVAGKTENVSATLTASPTTGSIHVESTPSGAQVWVDGADTGKVTPATVTEVTPGDRTVKLTLAGYQDWQTIVNVVAGQTGNVTATLTPLPGAIEVSSTPSGAAIWLDAADTGQVTPATLNGVAAGPHTVKLTLSGYADWETGVTVVSGQTTSVSATLTPAGAVNVSSTPSGAKVWLDGEDTGKVTPATFEGVAEGDHALKLTLDSYVDWVSDVNVVQGQTTVVAVTLMPVGGLGTEGLADSPWPKFRATARNLGRSPYTITQAPKGVLKWAFAAADGVESSPAIGSDGTVYVGSGGNDRHLYAINPDGSERWRFDTGSGVLASPAVAADGTIYIGAWDGQLFAVNSDGTQKWQFSTAGNMSSSPAVDVYGAIYVASNDHNLYAVNPDGTERWHLALGSWSCSSPAIGADGTVYVGDSTGNIYAVALDGTQKWLYKIGAGFRGTPAVGADGTVYVGGGDLALHAISPVGIRRWRFVTEQAIDSSPAIAADGTLYAGDDAGHLYAINANGTLKWRFDTGAIILSSPAVGGDGTIYMGAGDRYLFAINPDGTEKWRFDAGAAVKSSPALDSDGTLYVGSLSGYLYAIE